MSRRPFRLLGTLIIAVFVGACSAPATRPVEAHPEAPRTPIVLDGWPGEGRPVIRADAQTLRFHAAPDETAEHEDATIGKGSIVPFERSVIRTLKSVEVFSSDSMRVSCGEDLDRTVDFPADTRFLYLSYLAEGTGRFSSPTSDVCAVPLAAFDTLVARPRAPVTEWWVRTTRSGPAWLIVTGNGAVSVTEREF